MTYSFDGYNYLIRLVKGERLDAALEQFLGKTKIEGGWINGLGAASEATIGFYELSSKEYKWRTFGHTMEIASLTGNFARDDSGKMTWHLHGVFADEEYQTVGGHLKDLVAGATVEIFVHCSYQPMQRALDGVIGLQLLDLGESND